MADTFSMRVIGLADIDARLGALGPRLGPATLSLALVQAAEPTVTLARALVPYDERREKGRHLRDTIKATERVKGTQRASVDPATAHAFIGPAGKGSAHGHLVEFGHKLVTGRVRRTKLRRGGRLRSVVVKDTRRVIGHVLPHPFLEPAWDATREDVLNRFAGSVWGICVAVARGAADASKTGTLDTRIADSLEG